MKRKLKWLAICVAVSLVAFGTALFLWPRDRITAESWKKIRFGMSEKEVEGILGEVGMSEAEFDARFYPALADAQDIALAKKKGMEPFIWGWEDFSLAEPERLAFDSALSKYWSCRRGFMIIQFDKDHVIRKVFQQWRPADPTFLDHLRDWLGW